MFELRKMNEQERAEYDALRAEYHSLVMKVQTPDFTEEDERRCKQVVDRLDQLIYV